MSEIVLSMLRRRVLGLVIVVPRLAWRACPRRGVENGDEEPGLLGDAPDASADGEDIEPFSTAASIAACIPLGDGTGLISSIGVAGLERCGATSSGSTRSGGRRSFSISDLRLDTIVNHCKRWIIKPTYASSKLVIASLIPSAPSARVPYGSLPDPDTFLSSETRSDSSLHLSARVRGK